ncbi:MAG TPA: AtpZ/AtpI family protein [Armatimonadota bacterium]|jgi:F0F1-type ATP synthase assembly protein I|nr:AtpZ/AtpI family protein [Armatimonadota bacterium]
MKQNLSSGLELTTVGITLVITTAAGYFGGAWLDQKFGIAPVLTAVGVLFGSAAGFVQLFRVVGQSGRSEKDDDGQ